MIRVYAGEEELTKEVRGWLENIGYFYYPQARHIDQLKRAKRISEEDVLIEMIGKLGWVSKVVSSTDQRQDVLLFLSAHGIDISTAVAEELVG